MNQNILKRISLVATAALVASGAAMAQSSAGGTGGSSNSAGAVNGSSGTSGLTPPVAPADTTGASQDKLPQAPSVDYNRADPTAAGPDASASKPHKARHTGTKKGKQARDAASSPSVLDDANRAGGGSGNSNVR